MPARTQPLAAGTPLRRSAGLCQYATLGRRVPIRPVSKRRAAENRKRRRLVGEVFGGVHPFCVWPRCRALADDVHEILSRARTGGLITDPSIWAPLCRPHHNQCTREDPEAYAYGLLYHSWDRPVPGSFTAWLTEDGRWVPETPAGAAVASHAED